MNDHYSLILELYTARDYQTRLDLIQRNLDQLDEEFVTVLSGSVRNMESQEGTKSALATFCAILLAEIAFVHGKLGNLEAARRFAIHCLRAHQRALRILGEDGEDHQKQANNILTALLADAGEFRSFGLEAEGWQAYWIADPLYAAMDINGDDFSAGQLLAAAAALELIGMREQAGKSRDKAFNKTGDKIRFEREKKLAEMVTTSVLTELPPPDIYDGKSLETALRFASQTVGVICIKQTPCPKCRGKMNYLGGKLGVHKDQAYRECHVECTVNKSHPILTFYRDITSSAPSLAGLGNQLDEQDGLVKKARASSKANPTKSQQMKKAASVGRQPEPAQSHRRKQGTSPAKPSQIDYGGFVQGDPSELLASYLLQQDSKTVDEILGPYKAILRKVTIRRMLLLSLLILVISTWLSIVPWVVCYFLFGWLNMPSPFWSILIGTVAGLIIYQAIFLNTSLFSGSFLDEKPAANKDHRLLAAVGLTSGLMIAIVIGGWAAGGATLFSAWNLRMVRKRSREESSNG